jgi:hypothetical protein
MMGSTLFRGLRAKRHIEPGDREIDNDPDGFLREFPAVLNLDATRALNRDPVGEGGRDGIRRCRAARPTRPLVQRSAVERRLELGGGCACPRRRGASPTLGSARAEGPP